MSFFDEKNISDALRAFNNTPQLVWWKDKSLTFRLMNQQAASLLGYDNSNISFEGVTEYDLPCLASELADEHSMHDRLVINTDQLLSSITFSQYANHDWKVYLAHKYPLKDQQQKTIGMGGTAIDITHCQLFHLALLSLHDDLKLIGKNRKKLQPFTFMLKDRYDDFDLNIRESEILFLMIKGQSAKEIAPKINLSPRTVEKYIEQIKLKLGCYSRSQLIETAIQGGAGCIIPKSMLNVGQ